MVTGVILAAGQGRRMGKPKQLLSLGGEAMVLHVARTACQAGFDEVIVITGAYELAVKKVLQDLPLQIIYNEEWEQGQATSVKKAVQSIPDKKQAVVFLLADQPLVSVVLINKLINVYHETNASIIIPRALNQQGNPVLFDLGVWRSALLQLSGDEGARQIIRKNQEAVHYIELLNGQIFLDVDTPAEYEMMKELWQAMKKKAIVQNESVVHYMMDNK